MSYDIARDVYNALVVPTADDEGTLPPAFVDSHLRNPSSDHKKKPIYTDDSYNEGELRGILDAVASLCASEPRHHHVAVSLVHRRDSITLHIAQSAGDDVATHITDMVYDVWNLLGDFSRVIGRPDAKSKEARAQGHEAQRRILERLVRHGVRRLRYRVLKHWDKFEDVCVRLQSVQNKHSRTYKDFSSVVLCITELRRAVLSPKYVDWGQQVAPHLGRLYMAAQRLSAKDCDLYSLLSPLALSADDRQHFVYRITKYILKCTTLVDHANSVMKLATYRHQSPILSTPSFDIQLVPCRREQHPSAGLLLLSRGTPITSETLVSYSLHPECALLESHHNTASTYDDPSTPPSIPSQQIGTSTSPCHACRTVFAAYTTLRTEKQHRDEWSRYPVHVRLTSRSARRMVQHGLWLPPRLDDVGEDVEARFASQLLEEYRQHTVDLRTT